MGQTFYRSYAVVRGLEEYDVGCEFEVSSWGFAGSYWEPSEGIDMELLRVWLEPPPWAARHHPHGMPFALTDAECWDLEQRFYDDPPEADYGPDPDDERDRRYDEDRYDLAD